MDTGPQNAFVGDNDEPTQLPETRVDETDLNEERKMARFSKTAEFKRLREFMENRIKFYQHYLPDGSRVQGDPPQNLVFRDLPADLTAHWKAACIVISEFQNVLTEYEQIAERVKEHERLVPKK